MLSDLLLILGLIAANGVFAATEIAVISLRDTRISQLIEQGKRGARAVQELREQPERFLATVQVGITALGAAAAAYGDDSLGERAAGWLVQLPGLEPWAESLGFALTIVTVTFLSVVLGELVPKSLALRTPEPIALWLSRPLVWISSAARPAVWLLTSSSNLLLRMFGDKTSFTEARLSPDELQELVEQAATTGQLDDSTADIASRAFDLRDLSAEDVMRPRTQVTALAIKASRDQLLEVLDRELPDRLPLYEGTIDNVLGYVAVKEVTRQVLRGKPLSLRALLRRVLFVPPALPAGRLLARMQKERIPIAVVLDEGGGTKGLVQIEDLLEELVGAVHDDSEPPPEQAVVEVDGALVVRAETPIRELNRDYDLSLPEGEEWSTLGGLCIELAGRIPSVGSVLHASDGSVLEVIEADQRAVKRVHVRVPREGEQTTEERSGA